MFGSKFAPRGAASFLVAGERGATSSTFFRVAAGRGITEPSLLQHFARDFFFSGNPNLTPEKTTSYEAGIVQEWFGRRLYTEVTAFHNSLRDLIVFVSLPPPVWGSWDNVDRARARGLEFSGRARAGKHILFSASYTRMWSRVIHSVAPDNPFYGVGQELPRRPGNWGSVSMSVAPRRWSFVAGAVLAGERQDSDFWLGLNRNPGYQHVYASGSFRATRHVTPFFRVENLLNSRYQEVLGYSNLSRAIRGGLRAAW
jgi:vitamin B12 transporter